MYDNQENEQQFWPASVVTNFDPSKMTLEMFEKSPIWLKPLKWNQGGYDAVYVDIKKNLVRFVQITRWTEHSFKIEYFANFFENLRKIKDSKIEIKTLEIYFLVPKKNVNKFKIKDSEITGKGLLVVFGKGWEKNKEHDQVKVRGIQGFGQ